MAVSNQFDKLLINASNTQKYFFVKLMLFFYLLISKSDWLTKINLHIQFNYRNNS